MPPDWRLPPGVSRGLWDYLHDPAIARSYDERLADTPLVRFDQQFVLDHCPTPGRIIDLGSGTGRLAVTMARQGYWTLAVDLAAEMLKVTGEKATGAGVEVHRLQANLVDLAGLDDQSFGYAACLFSTLGMIAGMENRRRFLRHVHRLLKPGGVFVLHVHNRWFLLGTRHGRRLLVGNRLGGEFLMPPHQGLPAMPMYLFTRREIGQLVKQAGFQVMEIKPVGVEGPLRSPWRLGRLRAYGYLIAARKPPYG